MAIVLKILLLGAGEAGRGFTAHIINVVAGEVCLPYLLYISLVICTVYSSSELFCQYTSPNF